MRLIVIWFLIFFVLPTRWAMADPPMFGACPAVGTRLTTSLNAVMTVTGANGLVCSLVGKHGPFQRYALLAEGDGTEGKTPEWALHSIAELWPLAVGKSASYIKSRGGRKTSKHEEGRSWTVTGKESITVRAGTFDVHKIVEEERNIGKSAGARFFRRKIYYISTELGYGVKVVHERAMPDDKDSDWELVSVTKP